MAKTLPTGYQSPKRTVSNIGDPISQLAAAIARLKNQQQGGGGNNNGGVGGGGGGGSSGPVSTLAGLPQTPLLADLISKGIIKEGMPQEQALAILAISQTASQNPIDLAALKKMIMEDYGNTTGDINAPATAWMQQLYGANTPGAGDPNAALFSQDPIFGEYAGGLQQMQETANTNQATDLAWLDKQQQAMTDYYNGLIAGVSSGAIPVGGSGGGGGGGGGRRRGGGGGNGSGDGDPFTDPDTTITDTNQSGVQMKEITNAFNPEWYNGAMEQFGAGDPLIASLIANNSRPDPFTGAAYEEINRVLADEDAADQADLNNSQWTQAAPTSFAPEEQQYLAAMGLIAGDNPNTTEAEFSYAANPSGGLPVLTEDQQRMAAEFAPIWNRFQSGEGLGLNPSNQQQNLEGVAGFFNRLASASHDYQTQAAAPPPAPTPAPTPVPADQTFGGQPWDPSSLGWNIPESARPLVAPGPQSTADQAATSTGSISNSPDLTYNGGPMVPGPNDVVSTHSIPAGVGMDQLPPEIMQAAAQHAVNGPPGITDFNWALLHAGLPLLNGSGQLRDAISGQQIDALSRPGLSDWQDRMTKWGRGIAMGQPSVTQPPLDTNDLSNVFADNGYPGPGQTITPVHGVNKYAAEPGAMSKAPDASGLPAGLSNLVGNPQLRDTLMRMNALQGAFSDEHADEGGVTPTDIVNLYQGSIFTTDANGQQVLDPNVLEAYRQYSEQRGLDYQEGYTTDEPREAPAGKYWSNIGVLDPTQRIDNQTLLDKLRKAIEYTNPFNPQANPAVTQQQMTQTSAQGSKASSVTHAYDNPEVAQDLTGMDISSVDAINPDNQFQMDDNSSAAQDDFGAGQYGFRMPKLNNVLRDPYTIDAMTAPQLQPVAPEVDQYIQQAAQNMTRKKTGVKSYKAPGSNIKKTKTYGTKVGGNKLTHRKF